MRKSRKSLKLRNKKKTRSRKIRNKKPKNKKQKTYLLKGGWNDTDADFIAFDDNEKITDLGIFENNILQDLLSNINNRFSKDFISLDRAISFINTLPPDELTDDFDYEFPKFSIIPEGTIFYRRQKTNSFDSINRPIWLDYTGTISSRPFSFLKDINEEYTQEYLDETTNEFGEFLMKFKTNKNLLILHFPSYASSFLESWVRYMCAYVKDPICVDGYTLDFLKFNPNSIYKQFKSLDGFRELCILNAKNVSLELP
jgi:hypothetical protein